MRFLTNANFSRSQKSHQARTLCISLGKFSVSLAGMVALSSSFSLNGMAFYFINRQTYWSQVFILWFKICLALAHFNKQKPNTGSSRLMRISLLPIWLLRFFKTITIILLTRFYGLLILLVCSLAKNLANAIFG